LAHKRNGTKIAWYRKNGKGEFGSLAEKGKFRENRRSNDQKFNFPLDPLQLDARSSSD
jgi:hypothetical protein